jgi:glycosyltransferase involved in cell wall biosynthesis
MRVPVTRLPSAPSRSPELWHDSHLLRFLLLRRLDRNARFTLHCRGSGATLAGLEMRRWFKRATVVFDCRGAAPAAVRQKYERLGEANSNEAIAEIHREEIKERLAATGADHVLCLSHQMAQYFVHKYALPPDDLTVVPCCADYGASAAASCERTAARRELQIDGRLVVAYCGELEWYQRPELSLKIFEAIRLRHRQAHFLAITPSVEKMRQLCARSSLEPGAYTVLSVEPELVPRYLAAADIGLLPRAPGLDSRVSSPIKFGEYLACGLPVVASDGIGDFSSLVRSANLGMVLDDAAMRDVPTLAARLEGFVEGYRRDAATWRQRCQRVAQTELDWTTHLPNVLSLYRRLNTMR